jgi:hypothetical protein
MTLAPAGDSVWVSCLEDGKLHRYDVAGGAMDPSATITLPGGAVFGDISADGRTMVVPHQDPDGVAFIDLVERRIVVDVTLPREACLLPHVTRFGDDGSLVLLVCEGDRSSPGTFVVLDATTGAVRSVTPLGRYPDDIAILRGAP